LRFALLARLSPHVHNKFTCPHRRAKSGNGGMPVTNGDDAQRQQETAANRQRQEELKRDSEKVFQLRQELNDYLRKSGDKVASIDSWKKAEQIEKLAKSVRAKMKQSF
jgi:hypothetical protein